MSLYGIGILLAFLAPAFFAGGNILDSYLSNTIFKRLTVLIFITTLCYVVSLPLLWWFQPLHLVSFPLLVVAFLLAVMDIIYQYPYYWALRRTDTSIVVSLFSIGKIFVPAFAFLLVHEQLTILQYVGFFMIIFSTMYLSLDSKKWAFNAAFFLMFFVSLILAGQTVLYKYAFSQDSSWISVFSAVMVVELVLMSFSFINSNNRRDLRLILRSFNKNGAPLLGMEALSLVGNIFTLISLSIIPATVMTGIGSIQPLVALAYAEVFERRRKKFFHESLRYEGVRKKFILFVCIIVGTLLVAMG
jgi:drug/metabolite transporter (DMT)-like permease